MARSRFRQVSAEPSTVSYPVLVREYGTQLYTFTRGADDAEIGIMHIIAAMW
jgi:glutamyl/glutaminyl-tRNA synthetase